MTDVEQITKEPEEKIEKIKDPKKVAAGKRLAAMNKKSKQSSKEKEDNSSWIPDINFSTVIGIVGISLTAIDLYYRFFPKETKVVYKPKLETIKEVEEHPQQQQQQKRIGML